MIEVNNLKKHYRLPGTQWLGAKPGLLKAVDGVSFSIQAGETLGLVGESGSGKTTLGQMLLMQTSPTEGRIRFEGNDVQGLAGAGRDAMKGKVQVVFQDPYDSLNPRMRVRDIIAEPLRNLRQGSAQDIMDRVEAVTQRVGLRVDDLVKFPHQFSGGQRQRIGIARAISVNPKFVVLDEPVSALDVSVQAQVINLLMEIQEQHQIAYLFISHNLAIVEHICDRVLILYLGKVVEILKVDDLHQSGLHPYTRALIDSIPIPDPARVKAGIPLHGEIPDPMNLPTGCRFSPRCVMAQGMCHEREPELTDMGAGHWMACHRSAEL
jgi:oligopeptide/dipeptide ABC transporter ATP-binding protein